MIILDNLGKYRKGRLWVGQMPRIESTTVEVLRRSINETEKIQLNSSNIALELFLPPREISNYAFLGAMYTPNNGEKLEIRVKVSNANDKIFENSIALSSDEVHVGIPKDYAEAIVDSAEKTIKEIIRFSPGVLEFSIGAHGYIGSSKYIFSKTTEIILNIMSKNISGFSEDELKALVLTELTDVLL